MNEDTHICGSGSTVTPSVYQTLDEMNFERGPWSAALTGDLNRLQQLLSRSGVNINAQDNYGYTALHYAARNNRQNVCEKLLEMGADVFCRTRSDGATAAHRAAFAGHLEVLNQLLLNGGRRLAEATDNDGQTCLHAGYRGGHEAVVKWLLNQYPQLAEFKDYRGRLPATLVQNGRNK